MKMPDWTRQHLGVDVRPINADNVFVAPPGTVIFSQKAIRNTNERDTMTTRQELATTIQELEGRLEAAKQELASMQRTPRPAPGFYSVSATPTHSMTFRQYLIVVPVNDSRIYTTDGQFQTWDDFLTWQEAKDTTSTMRLRRLMVDNSVPSMGIKW